jgi:hypothetical protein
MSATKQKTTIAYTKLQAGERNGDLFSLDGIAKILAG